MPRILSVPDFHGSHEWEVVNNIKNQLKMHIDTEEFIRKSLKEHFSDDVTEKLIQNSSK